MSYRRQFTKTISVPYKGVKTYEYPASKTGGYVDLEYSGTVQETVVVDVNVDTTPFDSSVAGCNTQINDLTTSVAAMNTAQCMAISKNADKVSTTIIDGFFHAIRTDIGTQTLELVQTVEAKLLLLRQQAETLAGIKQKMMEDYERTTARYQKIFEDLNNELSVRIHEVDQPIFNLAKSVDTQSDRMLHTDMVQTVAALGKESGLVQAQIEAATVKRHALDAMGQMKHFLTSKAQTERTLESTSIDGCDDKEAPYLVPVCYMRTDEENHKVGQKCTLPEYYASQDSRYEETLCDTLVDAEFGIRSDTESEQIVSYLQSEISDRIKGDDSHARRVRTMINKLYTQKP